jgi:hypothetical protein
MKHPSTLLSKLTIQQTPKRKTKSEFKREALLLVRKYSGYKDDPSYQFFLKDLILGLSRDCEYSVINDLIKEMQRLKRLVRDDLE